MKYAMDYHVVPVLTNTSASAATTTQWVDVGEYGWVDFLYQHGNLTAASTVTLEECTGNDTTAPATEAAMPLVYRQTSATATDSLGAATTADSGGFTSSTGSIIEVVSVNPASLTDGYRYVRLAIAAAIGLKSAVAICYPRYAQTSPISSS